ncbi:hypothetical protein Mx9_p01 [Myxococcus phage Mx9]|nr:hypothetical protein Mx9_p01 [Myxococcus phage Mx9]
MARARPRPYGATHSTGRVAEACPGPSSTERVGAGDTCHNQ